MKIIKLAKNKPENYDEMKEWFEKRTEKHIDMVAKYCKKVAEYDDKYEELIERAKIHDASKFKSPELEPYIYVTWSYKCKDDKIDWEAPKDMEDKMNEATTHHVLNNKHHPEYWAGEDSNIINKEDRDTPVRDKIIDGIKMKDIDLAEMVCDWMAVSEERGNSPKTWADKNVNIRWKFNDKQKDLIYELIEEIWEK